MVLRFTPALVLALFAVLVPSGRAVAEQQPLMLDEVVVTSQKVEAGKQEVPANVSVFDGQAVEDHGVTSLEELAGMSSNVGVSKVDSLTTQLVFRGVGGMSNMNKIWNVNVDGVAVPYVGAGSMLDVERVEILRGSQGALYGRNNHAGGVNIYTRDPGLTTEGYVITSYESFNTWDVKAAAGGSATDTAGYRLAVGYSHSDGFIRNDFLDRDDTNDFERYMARGKVVFTDEDMGRLTLGLWTDRYDGGFDGYGPIGKSVSTHTRNNEPGYNDGYLFSPSVTWEKRLDGVDVTSITNFSRSNYGFLHDWDFSGLDLQDAEYDELFTTVSQELRFSGGKKDGVRWLLGLYGLVERLDTSTLVSFGNDAAAWGMIPGSYAGQESTIDTQIASVFGQLIYRVLPMVELTGAARVDYEHKRLDWSNASDLGFLPVESVERSNSWIAVSPSVSAAWLFTEDQRVYGSVARGFKAGDYNNVMVEPTLVRDHVDPEYTTTYEVGYKGRHLNDRLEVNAALFYIEWEDMQVDIVKQDSVLNNFQKLNAGEAHSSGVELETRMLLSRGWEAFVSAGYMFEYEFDEFRRDAATNLKGNKLPNTNGYNIGFGSIYRWPSGYFASVDGSYNGKKYLDEVNETAQSEYLLLNARVGYEAEDWDVYLYGRNLLDERYATTSFSGAFKAGEPLVVGLQASLRF